MTGGMTGVIDVMGETGAVLQPAKTPIAAIAAIERRMRGFKLMPAS